MNLNPCPACFTTPKFIDNYGGYVTCTKDNCHVSGPKQDKNGKKWNEMTMNLLSQRDVILKAIRYVNCVEKDTFTIAGDLGYYDELKQSVEIYNNMVRK